MLPAQLVDHRFDASIVLCLLVLPMQLNENGFDALIVLCVLVLPVQLNGNGFDKKKAAHRLAKCMAWEDTLTEILVRSGDYHARFKEGDDERERAVDDRKYFEDEDGFGTRGAF